MCFGNRREKKLISAGRSRKALLRRKRLTWVLKSEQNFQMWYCGMCGMDILRTGNHMKKVIYLGKYTLGFRNSGLVCMARKTWDEEY